MALGALPGQVSRMVVSEAFGIVAGGLALGIPATVVAAPTARSLLAGVLFQLPTDPLILLSSTAAILVIASLAAYVPACRAARIDPVASLEYE